MLLRRLLVHKSHRSSDDFLLFVEVFEQMLFLSVLLHWIYLFSLYVLLVLVVRVGDFFRYCFYLLSGSLLQFLYNE